MANWICPWDKRVRTNGPQDQTRETWVRTNGEQDLYKEMWGATEGGVPRGGLEPAMTAGLAEKPKELIDAYASGRAQYYGMYKRTFDGEDVEFSKKTAPATPELA